LNYAWQGEHKGKVRHCLAVGWARWCFRLSWSWWPWATRAGRAGSEKEEWQFCLTLIWKKMDPRLRNSGMTALIMIKEEIISEHTGGRDVDE